MSRDVHLGSYLLRVTDRGDDRVLDNFDENGKKFVPWVEQFVKKSSWAVGTYDPEIRHLCLSCKTAGGHTVHGELESGGIGVSGVIRDGQTGDLKSVRDVQDADMVPLYFQLFAPAGAKVAVLVLQKSHGRSPYPFFNDTMRHAFKDQFADLALHLQPFVANSVLSDLKSGRVTRIKVTSYKGQSDVASRVLNRGFRRQDVIVETTLKAVSGTSLEARNAVHRLIDGLRSRKPVEVPKYWEDLGEKITMTVRVGGRNRSLSYGLGREIVPYLDVTSKVRYRKDERPTFASIASEADNLALDIGQELGIVSK